MINPTGNPFGSEVNEWMAQYGYTARWKTPDEYAQQERVPKWLQRFLPFLRPQGPVLPELVIEREILAPAPALRKALGQLYANYKPYNVPRCWCWSEFWEGLDKVDELKRYDYLDGTDSVMTGKIQDAFVEILERGEITTEEVCVARHVIDRILGPSEDFLFRPGAPPSSLDVAKKTVKSRFLRIHPDKTAPLQAALRMRPDELAAATRHIWKILMKIKELFEHPQIGPALCDPKILTPSWEDALKAPTESAAGPSIKSAAGPGINSAAGPSTSVSPPRPRAVPKLGTFCTVLLAAAGVIARLSGVIIGSYVLFGVSAIGLALSLRSVWIFAM